MTSYVPNQTVMGLAFIGVLVFAAATGFQGWPFYWPIFLFAGFWALYLRLMPEDDRRILKSARGLMFGMFVGRGLAVILALGAGALVGGYFGGA